MLRHCILNSCDAGAAAQKGEAGTADRAKSTGQGSCCPQSAAKKRSHLVIGESALLIADYFDRVGFLKISR